MSVDDRSLAALLLTNRLTDTPAKPYSAAEFWRLADQLSLEELLGQSQADLSAMGLSPGDSQRIRDLMDSSTGFAMALEQLEQSGVNVVSALDEGYPSKLRQRLGTQTPPVLYTAGSGAVLDPPAVAIVGSRDVDEDGAEIARLVASQTARRGQTVVSGGARGVDQLAMNAAWEIDGCVAGVLAEGLAKRLRQPDIRQAIRSEQTLLCSPYAPDAGFNVGNAMGRNKVIYALADRALVVASAEDSGGTWAGAVEALKNHTTLVAVWRGPGEGPGNATLEQLGASPVESVEELFDLEWDEAGSIEEQSSLF
jgi:predicted Rossmann fold nucleotide-binding protein DprA/Smf involved in DNA uptake